jgi:hypothetical protein
MTFGNYSVLIANLGVDNDTDPKFWAQNPSDYNPFVFINNLTQHWAWNIWRDMPFADGPAVFIEWN